MDLPNTPLSFRSIRAFHTNLRLRSKLLLSLVWCTAALTAATLLAVRHSATAQIQKQVEGEVRTAVLTVQAIQQQHEFILRRKADLLATLAYMRGGDSSAIEDASEDPWQTGECDLFALADATGKIVALRASDPRFSAANAQELLGGMVRHDSGMGWWYHDRHLFQVVSQAYYDGESAKKHLTGTAIVGRELDKKGAEDLASVSSSYVVVRYGNDVLLNTVAATQRFDAIPSFPAVLSGQQIKIGGDRFYARSLALDSDAQPPITLTVLKSYDDALTALKTLNRLLLALGSAAFIVGVFVVFVIADRFTRPLSSLAEGVRALEQGDYSYPLNPSTGGDEVAQVTRAFGEMRSTLQRNETQRQELEGQLRQSQKMEAMGRLAGGVAHDFNNLLTVIKGNIGLLSDRLASDQRSLGYTRQIDAAADRAVSLTRQLLAFCRMQVLQPKILDLNQTVSEMCKLLRRLVREDIAFTFHAGESLGRVKADPGQIEQVILNLVVNAGDAMPAGGRLTIETHNAEIDQSWAADRPGMLPGEYVLLAVTDNGQGMDAETKARIFEPFFTTKEQGKGTGLGLATVYGIVKQSGGFIWLESEPQRGARFEIYLPRVHDAPEFAVPAEMQVRKVRGDKTVLIAEDEAEVRELAREFLKSAGYTVMTAGNGSDALAIARASGETIDILLTDVVMPKMRGPELAKKLREQQADLKIVYMSGYLDYKPGNEEFLEDGLFLQKPFNRESLGRVVHEALTMKALVAVEEKAY